MPRLKKSERDAASGRRGRKLEEPSPPRPKRGPSAFILFCKEERVRLTKEFPEKQFPEIGKTLGEMWRALSDGEKKKYLDLAEQYRARYRDQLREFEERGGNREDLRRRRKDKRGRKKRKDAPKRAATAFLFYSKDMREVVRKENPTVTFGDIGKLLALRWRDEDELIKEKYKKMAEDDKNRYTEEMKRFNAGEQLGDPHHAHHQLPILESHSDGSAEEASGSDDDGAA